MFTTSTGTWTVTKTISRDASIIAAVDVRKLARTMPKGARCLYWLLKATKFPTLLSSRPQGIHPQITADLIEGYFDVDQQMWFNARRDFDRNTVHGANNCYMPKKINAVE